MKRPSPSQPNEFDSHRIYIGARARTIVFFCCLLLAAIFFALLQDFVPTLRGDNHTSMIIYVILHDVCLTSVIWIGCVAFWALFKPWWLESLILSLGKKLWFAGQSMVWLVLIIPFAIVSVVGIVMIFRYALGQL